MYDFKYKPSPKNIVLDLIAVNQYRQLETPQLTFISEIFDISMNNLRVTLNRLVNEDLLANDERGVYRLTPKALSKREFINQWRSKQTLDTWDGSWLACYLQKGVDRTTRKKTLLALEWYGFKPGLDLIWVRPNNLVLETENLAESLTTLGIEEGTKLFVMSDTDKHLQRRWTTTVWPVDQLDQQYDALVLQILKSTQLLETNSVRTSLIETCQLGGEAIHCLALDPLLPKAIRAGEKYEELKQTMLNYDKLGRKIWLEELSKLGVAEAY